VHFFFLLVTTNEVVSPNILYVISKIIDFSIILINSLTLSKKDKDVLYHGHILSV